LLSLDAPTITALWSYFFARTTGIRLPWHALLILAIGTWLIYITDRILDGFRKSPNVLLHRRHHFHAQHRRAFLAAALIAGGILISLIVNRMSANARTEDTVLFLIALLYLFIVHRPGNGYQAWLPKELAVGAVFAAATAVPAWSRLTEGRTQLLPGILVFATLCWLNCAAIERWESGPTPLSNGATKPPATSHVTTRWAADRLEVVALIVAAISLFLWIGTRIAVLTTAPIYLAAFLAAFCFAVMDRHRERFSTLHLRIAADAILLTPLLLLPLLGSPS
jgi:hypothetical protein